MSRLRLTCLTLLLVSAFTVGRLDAQALDLEIDQVETLSYPGATAAFAVDATVATVAVAGDRVTIRGRAPGATHIVVIVNERTASLQVSVRDSVTASATARQVGGGDDTALVAGTVETRYLSSPELLQTTVRLFQQRGERSTELLFGGTKPLAGGPESVFNIPLASYRTRTRNSELTLLDRVVDNSPLTLSRVNIRGVHVRQGAWNAHAGYSFFSSFENLMLPAVREGVGGVGYRLVDAGRTITPNLYYFHRDAQSGGSGGLLGTVAYQSRLNDAATFLAEVGVSRGVAAAAELDVRQGSKQLWARLRFVPGNHPSLSVGQISGRSVDVLWSRTAPRLNLSTNLSTYQTAIGVRQHTSIAGARLDYRVNSRWMVGTHPGYSFFRTSQSSESPIQRVTLPANVGLSVGPIEALGDYELSRQTGTGKTGQSVQGTFNVSWKSLRLTARADRQTHAPTVSEIVAEAPWLQLMLDQLAVHATTPAQLAELVRTTANLSQFGYSNALVLNIAPAVTHRGLSLNWTGYGPRRPQLSVSALLGRQDLVALTTHSATHTLTYSQDAGPVGSLFVTWSSMCSRQEGGPRRPCQSIVSASLSQNLPNVVKGLLGRGGSAVIQGSVFRDDGGQGVYAEGMPRLANVEVVLDGERRTRSDGSGQFTFRGVRPGTHRVEALFSSDEPFFFTTPNPVVVGDHATVQIGVGLSLARLFGSVINDVGMPVGDAVVQIVGPDVQRTTRTNGDGTFSVQGLRGGTYEVRVDPASVPVTYLVQDLRPQSVRVDPSQPGRVDFVLRAFRSVIGSVRLYDACAGSYVPAVAATVTMTPLGVVSVTDQAGRYVFRDLPAGPQTISAAHSGSTATVTVNLPDGGALLRDVNVSIAPSAGGAQVACPASAAPASTVAPVAAGRPD